MAFDWNLIVFTCRSAAYAQYLRFGMSFYTLSACVNIFNIAFLKRFFISAFPLKALPRLKSKGSLYCSLSTEILIVEDPTSHSVCVNSNCYTVGSGGATLNALLTLSEHLSATRGLNVCYDYFSRFRVYFL